MPVSLRLATWEWLLYRCLNSWTDSGNWLARTSEIRYPLAFSICWACLPEVSLARPEDNLYFFPSASLPRLPGAVSDSTVITSGPCVLPVMIGLFGMVS